jgi:hypothetical protein
MRCVGWEEYRNQARGGPQYKNADFACVRARIGHRNVTSSFRWPPRLHPFVVLYCTTSNVEDLSFLIAAATLAEWPRRWRCGMGGTRFMIKLWRSGRFRFRHSVLVTPPCLHSRPWGVGPFLSWLIGSWCPSIFSY